jgi:hypothetical protein
MKAVRRTTHVDAVSIQYDENDPGTFLREVFELAPELKVEFNSAGEATVSRPGYSGDKLVHGNWMVISNQHGSRHIYTDEAMMQSAGMWADVESES